MEIFNKNVLVEITYFSLDIVFRNALMSTVAISVATLKVDPVSYCCI